MRRIKLICLLGAASVPLMPAPAKPAAAPVGNVSIGALSAAVDRIANDVMREVGYPGLAIAIERNGVPLIVKGYGLADVEHKLPVTADTAFPIGSLTKSFTALAVMQLVDKGKVDLDAPIKRYVPTLSGQPADVAVRHLLNHTSGIPNYTADSAFPTDLQKRFKPLEVADFIASRPLEFTPGDRFNYSNSNTYLLGLLIERASGEPLATYFETNVFRPFGMTRTRFAGSREIVGGRARGYVRQASLENARQYDVNYPFSAGAIISTLGDMLAYRRGVFGPSTSPSIRSNLLRLEKLNDGSRLFYALGCLSLTDFEGHRRLAHSGDIEGFGAHYAYFPDDQITTVVFGNLEHGSIAPYAIDRKLARAALGIPQPTIRNLAVPPAEAEAIAGDYRVGKIRFGTDRYGFLSQGGKMLLKFGGLAAPGPALPLLYQGGGRYLASFDNEFSFKFSREASEPRVEIEFYDGQFDATRESETATDRREKSN